MTKNIIFIILFFFLTTIMLDAALAADNLKNAFTGGGPLTTAGQGAGYQVENWDVKIIIGAVVKAFLSIIGVIFLILMIYAGYNWMTAHGDEQKVTKSKETITAAIIGLVIVIGAYAITFFVISKLTTGTLK